MNLLTLTVLLPLAGALLLAILPRERAGLLKAAAVAIGWVVFALSVALWLGFDPAEPGFQFVQRAPWIPSIGASWHVGLDGLSLLLFALTALLTPVALVGTWNAVRDKLKGYLISMLLLEAGMLGVFAARDLLLFYVYWEAMLIPMYLIIGIWGGPRRIFAAVKFIIYTLVGSLLMLVALLILYFLHGRATGTYSFDLSVLERFMVPAGAQTGLFLAFTLAFAIKVPLWPFHTWLPDAHVEAPTAGSVILAGVLLKMGTYGLLRFSIPYFPVAASLALPWMGTLAVIGILYGGLVAWVQKDIKSLVAYSSVAHLGFVVLGSFSFRAEGIAGSILQMVNHGLSTGALFLLVGFIYERRHTRDIDEFGGLAKVMPIFAAFLLLVAFSSAGLPGLNGFVGEFLILLGAFRTMPVLAVLAVPGVVVAALYLLRLLRGVLWGPLSREENRGLKDLDLREVLTMVPLAILIVWIGIYPRPFLRPVEPFARQLAARMATVRGEPPALPPSPAEEEEEVAAAYSTGAAGEEEVAAAYPTGAAGEVH